MTKSELITALAEEMRISENKARTIAETILESMSNALARGESIQLRGFCTFSVKHYGSYVGINPRSGSRVKVKSKRLPFFRASKELSEQVNSSRS